MKQLDSAALKAVSGGTKRHGGHHGGHGKGGHGGKKSKKH